MRKLRTLRPADLLLRLVVWLAAGLTAAALCGIIGFLLIRGVPCLKPSLFALHYSSENVSMLPAILTTVAVTALSLAIALPLGIFAAIYLAEYAGRGNRLVRLVRITAETLAGIPSIVYGLFGMLFFFGFLGWGYSLLSGSATLAIMVLPLLMRTTEEALRGVPDAYREGSFGLGAGRLRTVFRVVLPSAAPGILAGTILAVGRITGETAALLYTAGTVAKIPTGVFDSGRTLAVHMYALSGEGLYLDETYATGVVLLLLVFGINTLSGFLAKRLTQGGSTK